MRLRSLLFVPGDRPDRMMKAVTSDADALILDLEDSVAAEKKAEARQAVAAFLAMPRALPIFVRISGVDAERDLNAVIPARPDGIVLPKAEGGASVIHADAKIDAGTVVPCPGIIDPTEVFYERIVEQYNQDS